MALLAPAVLGMDPRSVQRVYDAMDSALKGHEYAKSTIDMACWDLLGKFTGLSLRELLGGSYHETLPLYTGIGIDTPVRMRIACERARAEGYRRFQVKVGSDVKTDIARARTCLEVLGDAEKVIFDANGYWSQHEAVRVIAQLADSDIYIEQPCATLEECAAVRKRSALPFILDESIGGYGDILRAIQIDAMDAVMMKLSRHGGITPIRRARDLCVQSGIAVTIEESGGGDIVSAAIAQLAATVPEGLLVN